MKTSAMKINVKYRNVCIACNILLNIIYKTQTCLHIKNFNVHIDSRYDGTKRNVGKGFLFRSSKLKMTRMFRTTLGYLNQD